MHNMHCYPGGRLTLLPRGGEANRKPRCGQEVSIRPKEL